MSLELTILGSAGSHPGTGRVCSGYLVTVDGTSLLLDAGNGSTANLQRFTTFPELDAIVVSHRHVDHCIDLIGAFYALRFDPDFQGRQVPLYAAAEVFETLASMMSADSAMSFSDIFAHREVGHGDQVAVGPMSLRLSRTVHPPPTVATRIEVGGNVLAYSADTAAFDGLVDVARDADLFLCESTWAGDPDNYPDGIHLTAREAATIAQQADVGKLVLTHIAGGTNRDQVLQEASEIFRGDIELAEDLARYSVSEKV